MNCVKASAHYAKLPKLLERHDMRHIRLRDLRHCCASLLLANGIGLKDIRSQLAHSTISTTANLYVYQAFASNINSADDILLILPGQKSEVVQAS